jgi:cation diffusion facilitator family transporter
LLYDKCVFCRAFIGWIGLIVNLVLMFLKGFIGILSGSSALLADAMYSAKDVVTSILVIVSYQVAKRPLDSEHPYGHGKIEFILSLVISVVFLSITVVVFVHALELLWMDIEGGDHTVPHVIALWAALVSVLVNTYMYFYSKCVFSQANSPMVKTLSMHHHADIVSSLAVAIGLAAALFLNLAWIDTVVALFETVHLMYLGGRVFSEAYKGLMDGSAPKEVYSSIKENTLNVSGVNSIDALRSRLVGQDLNIDMSIGVDPDISIQEANEICENVVRVLSTTISHIGFVNVKFGVEEGKAIEVDEIHKEIKSQVKKKTGDDNLEDLL